MGIGTPTPQARVEIKSSDEATPAITDGLLIVQNGMILILGSFHLQRVQIQGQPQMHQQLLVLPI
jgi:hypothetical protein